LARGFSTLTRSLPVGDILDVVTVSLNMGMSKITFNATPCCEIRKIKLIP